jgi:hypothetical protein
MNSRHHQIIQCQREGDVLDALASARWPHRAGEELIQHVASCEICQDVITVASAIQSDHDVAYREANVPSSGQMWWRAEMRARQDAIREASRPVAVAQGVAVVLALVVAIAAAWFAWPSVHDLLSTSTAATAAAGTVGSQPGIFASSMLIPLAVAMGALLVIAPLALYVVLSEK